MLLIGVGLLILSVLVRVLSQGKYEIKTIDLVFIIVPLLFMGLATGKIKGLDLFGVKADLSELWAREANAEIAQQVAMVPISPVEDAIEMIETAEKRGIQKIPKLIEKKTQALAFHLGMERYYGPAIEKYFNDLYGSSYLRYVVIKNPDDILFGMYNAANLIAYLRTHEVAGYETFQSMLNRDDDRSREWLARLPSFAPAQRAVTNETPKRDALQEMEKFNLDSLPVRDSSGHFIGTVDRDKLTTSLVLAVTQKLPEEQSEK